MVHLASHKALEPQGADATVLAPSRGSGQSVSEEAPLVSQIVGHIPLGKFVLAWSLKRCDPFYVP